MIEAMDMGPSHRALLEMRRLALEEYPLMLLIMDEMIERNGAMAVHLTRIKDVFRGQIDDMEDRPFQLRK